MAVSLLLGLPALNLQPRAAPHRARCVRMGLFDGLAAAFENDDSLGERQDLLAALRAAWRLSLSGSLGLRQVRAVDRAEWIGRDP